MIAALYVAKGGCYFGLENCDPWDEARDARLYAGPHPVVAHPPCARWCLLAGFVASRGGKAKGDDGVTFAAALTAVRAWGGVLEHPAHSAAFARYQIGKPTRGGWSRAMDGIGWICEVDQANYGHLSRKPTWLYCARVSPPSLNWRRTSGNPRQPTWMMATHPDPARRRKRTGEVQRLSARQRSATPIPFRDLLISIASSAIRPAAEVA